MSHHKQCDAERDIMKALMRLRYVCAQHDIPCPDILGFSNTSDTDRAYRAYQDLIPPWSASRDSRWTLPNLQGQRPSIQIHGFSITFEPLNQMARDYYAKR